MTERSCYKAREVFTVWREFPTRYTITLNFIKIDSSLLPFTCDNICFFNDVFAAVLPERLIIKIQHPKKMYLAIDVLKIESRTS